MLPTPIGTPLHELKEVENLRYSTDAAHFSRQDTSKGSTHSTDIEGPKIRRMNRPEELARSRQIIEIGAMAITGATKLDPRLNEQISHDTHSRILKKLEDIETYLHCIDGDSEDALRGCAMIRETLHRRVRATGDTRDAHAKHVLDAPGQILPRADCDMYDGNENDVALMAMLMRENGCADEAFGRDG
jgi:hypothetical protein